MKKIIPCVNDFIKNLIFSGIDIEIGSKLLRGFIFFIKTFIQIAVFSGIAISIATTGINITTIIKLLILSLFFLLFSIMELISEKIKIDRSLFIKMFVKELFINIMLYFLLVAGYWYYSNLQSESKVPFLQITVLIFVCFLGLKTFNYIFNMVVNFIKKLATMIKTKEVHIMTQCEKIKTLSLLEMMEFLNDFDSVFEGFKEQSCSCKKCLLNNVCRDKCDEAIKEFLEREI